MKIEKKHILGILAAIILVVTSIALFREQEDLMIFLIGIGIVFGAFPFVISSIMVTREDQENDRMFLEFSRDLVENVKAGTPISQSIINVRSKHYGSLTPHVKKLANQISVGIPVQQALSIFVKDVDSPAVRRAIDLISEAEKAGGDITDILDSVTDSIEETEKLKKERKASVYSLVVEGYIIFIIFVGIMLLLQFSILPMISDVGEIGDEEGRVDDEVGMGLGGGGDVDMDMTRPLLFLLLAQGFFAGFVIGKLSEGKLVSGIKHSFALVTISLLIYTGANAFF